MIIGHGDIASVLQDREDRIYFASGVANSGETRESEYEREIILLKDQNPDGHLIYFSSLCIFYSDNRYAQHKREMEYLVKRWFAHYTIMRIGNITWGTNPNTIINFLRNKLKNHEPFELHDVYRYVVDKEEFLHWIDLIPPFSVEMNIVGKRMKVKDIFKEYCYPYWWGTKEAEIAWQNLVS